MIATSSSLDLVAYTFFCALQTRKTPRLVNITSNAWDGLNAVAHSRGLATLPRFVSTVITRSSGVVFMLHLRPLVFGFSPPVLEVPELVVRL
jgi:hypothetical protein